MKIAITFDVDWAPDWCVYEVATVLVERRIKSTWFITHDSETLSYMRNWPQLFEIGIHPNCLPGSSHGATETDVLSYMMDLVPETTVMRTHGLYQSVPFLYNAAVNFGISLDSSTFLSGATHVDKISLIWKEMRLAQIPFFFEDDFEFPRKSPRWNLGYIALPTGGVVFNFHPVHFALNTKSHDEYAKLKSRGAPANWTREAVAAIRQPGRGPRELLYDLLAATDYQPCTMTELAASLP